MAKPDWITITPASGSNNGSFDVTAAANTGLARNGIITVAGGGGVSKTCDIVQKSGKAIFAISNISIASEAVLSDVNPKYGEPIDRDVEVHLMVGSPGLIDMQITFEGVYRIVSAKGDNEGMGMSTTIQGFNVIVEIDDIWMYAGGAHITVTGYDKANTPFECYISLMAQMM